MNHTGINRAVDEELALRRLAATSRGNVTDAAQVYSSVAEWDHPVRLLDFTEINEALERAPIVDVPAASLTSMHARLNRAAIEKYLRGPAAVEIDGQRYVLDGHHRTASRILRGDTNVPMRLVRADAEGHIIPPISTQVERSGARGPR